MKEEKSTVYVLRSQKRHAELWLAVRLVVGRLLTVRAGDGSLNAAMDLQFEFGVLIKWHHSFERSGN